MGEPTVTLTRENIRACMLRGGGYFVQQRRLLGSSPSEMHWVDKAVGRVVSAKSYIKAISLAAMDDFKWKSQ